MTEETVNTKATILSGGEIEFIDIASLAIATALFISQGNDEILDTIGKIADSLKEGFVGNEEEESE